MGHHAAQGPCIYANCMPFLRYARGSRAGVARPYPGLSFDAFRAGADRHRMSVLSSKHLTTSFWLLRRLCETSSLVTIFLPKTVARLLAAPQQRELDLRLRHRKVTYVT